MTRPKKSSFPNPAIPALFFACKDSYLVATENYQVIRRIPPSFSGILDHSNSIHFLINLSTDTLVFSFRHFINNLHLYDRLFARFDAATALALDQIRNIEFRDVWG